MMLTDERPDLVERLASLGEHLDAERAAVDSAPDFEQLDRRRSEIATNEPRRSTRVLVVVAASVVLLGGLAGLANVRQRPSQDLPPTSVELAPDPPGPLFVLPDDLAAFPVSGGDVTESEAGSAASPGNYLWAAIGTPVDGGYEDLVGAWSFGASVDLDERLAIGEWEEVTTSNGPAHVWRSSPSSSTIIVQERGDRWMQLSANHTDEAELLLLLSSIELGETGAINVVDETRTAFAGGAEASLTGSGTGFSVAGPKGEFWIETASLSSPLALLGNIGDRVEPIAIGDRQGWLVSAEADDGLTPYAVVWSATRGRIIAVGSNSDSGPGVDELMEVAESLQIVDEQAWRTALPAAISDIP